MHDQTELNVLLHFSVQRPHRQRFLLWVRHYSLVVGIILTGIVALSTVFYAFYWTVGWLILYWLYHVIQRRMLNIQYVADLARSQKIQLIRAIVLIVGVSIFLWYLYSNTTYGKTPEIDSLWLLYILAIFIMSQYGNMWQVAVVCVLSALTFTFVRLQTAFIWSQELLLSIGIRVMWLGLLAFIVHVLIRLIKDQSANLALLHRIQRTLMNMRTQESDLQLLQTVVEKIAEEFHYPHVNIFLIDTNGDLCCVAAASPGGRSLVEQHYFLETRRGIIGHVAYTGNDFLAADVRNVPFYIEHPQAFPDTKSELVIPIKIDHKVIGVLDLQHQVVDGFPEHDRQVMRTMVDLIEQSFDNMQLLKSREQVRHLIELIARRFLSHQELDATLEEIVESARDTLQADVVVLYERDPQTDETIVGACSGELRDSEHFSATVTRTNHLVHRLLQTEQSSHFHSDAAMESRDPLFQWDRVDENCTYGPFIQREAIRSRAIIRLQTDIEAVGVMFLNYRTPRIFDDQEKEAHFIFADLAALAIQKAQAQRQMLLIERENLAWLVHDQSAKDAMTILDLSKDLLADEQFPPQYRPGLQIMQNCIQSIANDFAFLQGTLEDIPSDNLEPEVKKIIQRMQYAYDVAFDECWEGDISLVEPSIVYQLRLIVNEAMMNAVRHGKARSIHFRCSLMDRHIRVEIIDNGRGFDAELIHPRGLNHIHERSARMGGTCVIESAPGAGTRVMVLIPVGEP